MLPRALGRLSELTVECALVFNAVHVHTARVDEPARRIHTNSSKMEQQLGAKIYAVGTNRPFPFALDYAVPHGRRGSAPLLNRDTVA